MKFSVILDSFILESHVNYVFITEEGPRECSQHCTKHWVFGESREVADGLQMLKEPLAKGKRKRMEGIAIY